jgi:hypothetical protein
MMIRSTLAAIAVAGAALTVATPALADAVVVRSTGPSAASYPVGRRLPPADRIVLRAGDRVVLVGEGSTRTLSGPGNFPVRAATQASQGAGSTLARYLSTTGSAISRTGAVRGPGTGGPAEPSAPNLWVVDVARSGTICVADMNNITLWRADMRQDTLLTVQDSTQPGQSVNLAFVAGANFRPWEGMPVVEGHEYRISAPGMARPTVIRFASTPSMSTDPALVAATLADKGCTTQLAMLGDRIDSSGN